MIPISDVIPTRTSPVLTIALMTASVLFASAMALGNPASLLANVACLWLFGWTVEDRLDHLRFGALFGMCAATGWMVGSTQSAVPGGTAGVLGAYFMLYPKSLMLILVPLPSFLREVPAVTFLALWFVSQLLLGPFPFLPQLTGFLSGAVLCLLLKRPERLRVEWWSPQVSGFTSQVSGPTSEVSERTRSSGGVRSYGSTQEAGPTGSEDSGNERRRC